MLGQLVTDSGVLCCLLHLLVFIAAAAAAAAGQHNLEQVLRNQAGPFRMDAPQGREGSRPAGLELPGEGTYWWQSAASTDVSACTVCGYV
jgi:hypothetical protein